MSESLRKERERLLNRLAEIQAELNRIETKVTLDGLIPVPEPAIGQVWCEKIRGTKVFIRGSIILEKVRTNLDLFEFVCDRAHGDGDFSYICGFENCRCSE